MAHFAKIESDVVVQVIVVDNKDTADTNGVEKEYIGAAFCERLLGGTWKQTSYNGNFRKNYAGLGYTTMQCVMPSFRPSQAQMQRLMKRLVSGLSLQVRVLILFKWTKHAL